MPGPAWSRIPPTSESNSKSFCGAIASAIEQNQLSKLKNLMEGVPETSRHTAIPGADGNTPLMVACGHADLKTVKAVLVGRPDLTITNKLGLTALHIACKEGHHLVLKALVANGGRNPNTVDKQSQTPLMSAAMAGHKACVKLLLSVNALALVHSVQQDSMGRTALMLALLEGHADVAKLLLEDGANPDVQQNDGMTPLMVAANNGDAKSARLLVKHNADITPMGPMGMAIDIALENGHGAVATAIRQGIDRAIKQRFGHVIPMLGLNKALDKISKVSKAKKGPVRVQTTKGIGFQHDDGEIWVKGKGHFKPNGDWYEDIPYFD